MTTPEQNLDALYRELDWLQAVIHQVIASYLKHEGHEAHWMDIAPPPLDAGDSVYAQQVVDWQLDTHERLAFALALAPHLRPEHLDILQSVNANTGRSFSEFGGYSDKTFNGFMPTGQTLAFLLSGNDPAWRLHALRILSPSHQFATEQVVQNEKPDERMPQVSRLWSLSDPWVHYLLTGEKARPELSPSFPASPITTPLDWSDLVLDHRLMSAVNEVRAWLTHGPALMQEWGLARKVRPGFRAVFYGPPGTGKTLTAALLGKSTGREVYRVDLSMIVSKYIGEIEKNLGKVFDAASHKDWILFFDEADALFGKRTAAVTSNDRHANQQTGYLLQRIEDHPGTVILATNLKANMDEAFTRRFQAMVSFDMPAPAERLKLWKNAFCGVCQLDEDVDLERIAQEHELAGGAIINVLRHSALNAIARNSKQVSKDDVLSGIKHELRKVNRTAQFTQE
jgi:DNA polymerase III delta prime subunit